MIEKPLVSIIIPIYNAEDYLAECLDSVLDQSLHDIEVICVNDGSTDSTAAILSEYQDRDDRLIILDKAHSNAGASRNAAMAISRGTYLAFLDADDRFEEGMLQKMTDYMTEKDLDVILCRSFILNDQKNEISYHEKPILSKLIPKRVYSADDLWGKAFRYAVGWPWDKVFRRSFIEERRLRFQELESTNDAYFVYMALALVSRFAYLDDRLVTHRIGIRSSIENTRDRTWQNLFKAIDAIEDGLRDNGILPSASRDLDNWIAEMCIWNLHSLDSSAASFYEYVQRTYAPRFSNLPDEHFYESDHLWRFQIWAQCDYELAMRTFSMEDALRTARIDASVSRMREEEAQERASAAERLLSDLRSSRSYRIGKALTKPVRVMRSSVGQRDR